MKTREEIGEELRRMVEGHYYSEDFELLASVRAYDGGLEPAERAALAEVVSDRLARDGSMVDVLLCSVIDVPGAGSLLAGILEREESASQMSRALIRACRAYPGDATYVAVARFLDSEQEGEALTALAAMDFVRTLPHLARLLAKDHHLDTCLHILYERRKTVGLPILMHELQVSATLQPPPFRERLRMALRVKTGDFNPFSEDDLRSLESALRRPGGV